MVDRDIHAQACELDLYRFNTALEKLGPSPGCSTQPASALAPITSIPARYNNSPAYSAVTERSGDLDQHLEQEDVPPALQPTPLSSSHLPPPLHTSQRATTTTATAMETGPPVRVLSFGSHTYAIDLNQLRLPPHCPYNLNPQMLVQEWDHAPFHCTTSNPEMLLDVRVKDWLSIYKGTHHWRRLKDDFSQYKVQCNHKPSFFHPTGSLTTSLAISSLAVLCAQVAVHQFRIHLLGHVQACQWHPNVAQGNLPEAHGQM